MLGVDNATSEVVLLTFTVTDRKSEQDYRMPFARQSVGQYDARYQRCLKRTSCK